MKSVGVRHSKILWYMFHNGAKPYRKIVNIHFSFLIENRVLAQRVLNCFQAGRAEKARRLCLTPWFYSAVFFQYQSYASMSESHWIELFCLAFTWCQIHPASKFRRGSVANNAFLALYFSHNSYNIFIYLIFLLQL